MATNQPGGIAHLTVVPENFEPDAESEDGDGDDDTHTSAPTTRTADGR